MSNAWAIVGHRQPLGLRAWQWLQCGRVSSCLTGSSCSPARLPSPHQRLPPYVTVRSQPRSPRYTDWLNVFNGLRPVARLGTCALCTTQTTRRSLSPVPPDNNVFRRRIVWAEKQLKQGRKFTTSQAKPQTAPDGLPVNVPSERDPLPGGDLSQKQVEEAFGKGVDKDQANHVLRAIQYRRATGRLIDDGLQFPAALRIQEHLIMNALAYLRTKYPMDEEAAAQAYAEAEAQRLEESIVADAERLGFYKRREGEDGSAAEDGRSEETSASSSVYGKSGLETIREQYELQRRDTESKDESMPRNQADEVRDNAGPLVKARNYVELRRAEKSDWIKYYEEQAVIIKDKVAPQMSTWARLWPSAFITLITLAACALFAQVYTPPRRSARLWPDVPPAAATIIGLLTVNSAILVLWRVPLAWRFLNKYFLQVPGYPTAFSVIGNIFSHQQISHFLSNMVVLWVVGTRLHEDVGRGNFLAIYMAGGAFGSFTSLLAFVMRKNFLTSSLGASGAVAAVFAAWCAVNSEKSFSVIFFPESFPSVSPNLILLGAIAVELYGLRKKWAKVDYFAHLGGYAAGYAGAQMVKANAEQRKRKGEERRSQRGIIQRIKEGR